MNDASANGVPSNGVPRPAPESRTEVPRGDLAGFRRYFPFDVKSGFLVFLIALPLCLGISVASGYPPIAGIFTAIVGAIVATCLSNSELTIKGPAAGLIVIVVGCVGDFGGNGLLDGVWDDADQAAYRAALAVGTAAAVLQILFGLFRAGILGEFFPTSTVHGMLAAIGVIIMVKQFPVALGVSAKGEPLEMIREIPHYVMEANPAIASIGLAGLAIMFSWPAVVRRVRPLAVVPAPLVVLAVTVPMGMVFDLLHEHSYVLQGHQYQLGEQYLVKMPDRMFGMFRDVVLPDFSALAVPKAWKWVLMFFAIGSLESLLSAKAVDLLDPWRRRTDMDRDVTAVGIGNLCAALVGGLPMISEIVRSRANIDNGARTRFADLWHGMFLLVCVALIPTILHRIPLAALASMLVYTGFRLAHPAEFVNVWRVGREQLLIFVATLVGVLATDLLIGVGIGIAVKFSFHVLNGVPLSSLFKPFLEIEQLDETTALVRARRSAVFSNWIPFRRQLEQIGLVQRQNVVLDLSGTKFVDHSTMEKLHEMQGDFAQEGLTLEIVGLDSHRPVAEHRFSARRRSYVGFRRLTIVAEARLEPKLTELALVSGATACNAGPCRGVFEHDNASGEVPVPVDCVRFETIVPPEVSDLIVAFLREEIFPVHRATFCIETVEVLPRGDYLSRGANVASHAPHAREEAHS